MSRLSSRNFPPWEVLSLVAQHLDPKTLAIASCVSKSWYIAMSSDYLWQPICSSHYPSLSNLKLTDPSDVSYRRLFSVGYSATKRRLKTPPPPRISLDNLIFAVELSTIEVDALIFTLAKSANELRCADTSGVFWFDIDINVNCFRSFGLIDLQEEVGITWNVLLRGWGGVFTMMDYEGRVSFSPAASESWFSEELPSPRCCSSEAASGIVADLRLGFSSSNGFCEDEKVRVAKACVGMLSIVNWRYVTVDDGLRYLQHFLLPNSTMCM